MRSGNSGPSRADRGHAGRRGQIEPFRQACWRNPLPLAGR